jgi:uncharacterized membrane protein
VHTTTYRTILLVFVQHHNFIIILKVTKNGNYGLTKLNKRLIINKLPSDVFMLLQTLSEAKSQPIGHKLYENTAENMLVYNVSDWNSHIKFLKMKGKQ